MNVRQNLVNFLVEKNTHKVPHGNRSLYEHLIRCYDIAVTCKFSRAQSLACGLHSIYGTDIFKSPILTTRNELAEKFSEEVEHLVYLFHSLDRKNTLWIYESEFRNRFVNLPLVLTEQEVYSLKRIELVNLFEQYHTSKFARPAVGFATSTTNA